MKRLIYICVGLLLYTCNSFSQSYDSYPIKYYQKPENPKSPLGELTVTLNKDHTYLYTFRGGWIFDYSFGYWDIDSNKKELILTSMISSTDSIPLIVQEKQSENNDVQFVFGTAVINDHTQWSIVLNGKEYPIVPDSIISIEGVNKVDSFFIQGYNDYGSMTSLAKHENIKSITYYPHEKYNFYQISFPSTIDCNIFHFVPLRDTLKIKRNNLFWDRKIWNKTVKLEKRK